MQTHKTFKLGNFTLTALNDGDGAVTADKMFPTTDPTVVNDAFAAQGYDTNITVGRNVLHVQTETQSVLIDAGLPDAHLSAAMDAAGIDPAKIDVILVTHGDGDHIGGLKNFPNAQIMLPQKAWELWSTESGRIQMVAEWCIPLSRMMPSERLMQAAKGRAKYGSDVLPALANAGRVNIFEADTEVLPGFKFIEAFGHRSDHYAVQISSGDETLVHIVDAFRHPIQIAHRDWTDLYTSHGSMAAETTTRLFELVSDLNAPMFGSHFAFPGLARMTKEDGEFVWSWGI